MIPSNFDKQNQNDFTNYLSQLTSGSQPLQGRWTYGSNLGEIEKTLSVINADLERFSSQQIEIRKSESERLNVLKRMVITKLEDYYDINQGIEGNIDQLSQQVIGQIDHLLQRGEREQKELTTKFENAIKEKNLDLVAHLIEKFDY